EVLVAEDFGTGGRVEANRLHGESSEGFSADAAGIITPGSKAAGRPLPGRRSAHRGEVDREATDVAAFRVADHQDHTRLRRDLLAGESIHAAREIAAAFLSHCGAFVLDEAGLDLAVAQEDARREEP